MKNVFSLSLLAFLVSLTASAQYKLIEKVEKKGDEIVIPYERYQLDN
jgi:zinc protease